MTATIVPPADRAGGGGAGRRRWSGLLEVVRALGVQHVEGEESPFFGAGTSLAAGVRAGASVRLARRWTGGVSARWDLVGTEWSEQVGAAWVRWAEEPSNRRAALPPVYGAAVTGLEGCG